MNDEVASKGGAPGEVTQLLRAARGGDSDAYHRVYEIVYGELRRLASSYLRREQRGHTLQPTALVHEVYLRLGEAGAQDRAHFMALAARTMRQVLVDHARRRRASKRGGGAVHVALDEALDARDAGSDQVDILAVDGALRRLEQLHERQARVVELRLFSGLTAEETAEALAVSTPTVNADWLVAKRFIQEALRASD